MNKKNLCIIWDWNGTLVNDACVFINIMNKYLSERSLPLISLKDYKNHFCFPVINYYQHLGFNLNETSFRELSFDFINEYKKVMFDSPLVEGVKPLISSLNKRGFIQFLVSAQENSLLKLSVEYYGLNKNFSGVFGLNNNFAVSKKGLVSSIIQKKISSKDVVVLVGDTVHDFDVASAVGAIPCLVDYGHNSKKKLCDTGAFVASSLDEVSAFLNTLSTNIN